MTGEGFRETQSRKKKSNDFVSQKALKSSLLLFRGISLHRFLLKVWATSECLDTDVEQNILERLEGIGLWFLFRLITKACTKPSPISLELLHGK